MQRVEHIEAKGEIAPTLKPLWFQKLSSANVSASHKNVPIMPSHIVYLIKTDKI